MKDFFKKLSKQQDLDDLDTGYDSDYYGGSYSRQPAEASRSATPAGEGYDDRYERDMYNRDRDDAYGEDNRFYSDRYARPVETPVEPEPEVEAPSNAGTLYYTPESYRDCREAIVSGLAESHVVVVNVKLLDAPETVRLFDYIMGAVLALEADMTRLNNTMLLLAPKDVEVTEDDLRSLFTAKTPMAETVEDIEEEDQEETDVDDDFIGYDDLSDEMI